MQLSDPGASALLRTDIRQASPSGARRLARLTNSPSPDRENADWLTLGGAYRRSSSGARHPKRDRPAVCSSDPGLKTQALALTRISPRTHRNPRSIEGNTLRPAAARGNVWRI